MDNHQEEMQAVFYNDGLTVASNLDNGLSETSITENIKILYNQVELLTDSFLDSCNRTGVNVDCKMKCEWCCHQAVFALTHEVLVIADYIRSKFSHEVVRSISDRAAAKSLLTTTKTNNELLKNSHSCPLLSNGVCMVYPVRPLACRIYLSSNVNTCIEKYKTPASLSVKPTLFSFPLDAGRFMNEGYVQGLKLKGLNSNEAPLEWLLNIVLNDETSFKKWLSGESINESYIFE